MKHTQILNQKTDSRPADTSLGITYIATFHPCGMLKHVLYCKDLINVWFVYWILKYEASPYSSHFQFSDCIYAVFPLKIFVLLLYAKVKF